MSRFIIETFSGREPNLVIKVVFFGLGYNNRWLRSESGSGVTIPYLALEQLILKKLEKGEKLDSSFFDEYKLVAEENLYDHLINKGKSVGARERARGRMEAICEGIRAIVIVDYLADKLRVQCINKGKKVAFFNPAHSIVTIGEDQWVVDAQELGFTKSKPAKAKSPRSKQLIPYKKHLRLWWNKHAFAIISTIFFITVATCIIVGLFTLRQMIESPDQAKKLPGAPSDTATWVSNPIDSVGATETDSTNLIVDTTSTMNQDQKSASGQTGNKQ